ncbi:MAG TPA: hypothetical protein VIL88_01180 [Devosia sp.]|jgi:hypothetical protein|uniref:hypothetical protein n=1 Tax=Devosia sp. TaxID=1871048 RepID=UPI002F9416B4
MQYFAQSVLEAIELNTPIQRDRVEPPVLQADVERVQLDVVERLGGVGAWKVSPWTTTGSMWAGPIPSKWIRRSGEAIEPGRYSIEVEFALVRTEAGDYVLAPAFELLQSRLDSTQDWPASAKEADLFSTAGLVIGTSHPLPSEPLSSRVMVLTNGKTLQSINTELSVPKLLQAASWTEEQAVRLGIPVEAGTIILTGARIGPLPQTTSYLRAEISGFGFVEIGVEP